MWSFLKQRDAAGVWKFLTVGGKFARSDCATQCCGGPKFIYAKECCDPRNVIAIESTSTCADGSPVWVQGSSPRLLHFTPSGGMESCYLTDPSRTYTLVEVTARLGTAFDPNPQHNLPCSAEGAGCNAEECPQCDCCMAVNVHDCSQPVASPPAICCEMGSEFVLHVTLHHNETESFRDYAFSTPGGIVVIGTGTGTGPDPDPCTGQIVPSFCYSPLSGWMIRSTTRVAYELQYHYKCIAGQWIVTCETFTYGYVATTNNYIPINTNTPNFCPPAPGYVLAIRDTVEARCSQSGCDEINPCVYNVPNFPPIIFPGMDWTAFVTIGETGCAGQIVENIAAPGVVCPTQPAPGASTVTTRWSRGNNCFGGFVTESRSTDGNGLYRRNMSRQVRWQTDVVAPCTRTKCPPPPPPFPFSPPVNRVINRSSASEAIKPIVTAGSFL